MKIEIKPHIQSVKHRHYKYKCSRPLSFDLVGFGKTPEEAWSSWYSHNVASDKYMPKNSNEALLRHAMLWATIAAATQ
jgi:hypothetical protein